MTLKIDKKVHIDLFSGIGGFALAADRTWGKENVEHVFCEIEPFPQKVLKKHWPDAPIHSDIKEFRYDGPAPFILTGGFPCQDVSGAGLQGGIEAKRSGLWGELCRVIDETRPKYAIMENVSNLLAGERGSWFGRVLRDLAAIGYDAEWHCIRAFRVGLPQNRDRVWIMAYPAGYHVEQVVSEGALPREFGRTWRYDSGFNPSREIYQPPLASVDDGLPVTAHTYKAYGNAVVPQIPEMLMKCIQEVESL